MTDYIDIQGKYGTARVFGGMPEQAAYAQVLGMMCQPWAEGSTVRVMPDVHAGKGCTIGTTMTITDKVVPNLVGVDIGCGVIVAKVKETHIEFGQLDKVIRQNIPSGAAHRKTAHRFASRAPLADMIADVSPDMQLSIGSLGGGNHFIEVDRDDAGALYVVIHSGSRHLGVTTCNYWQRRAIAELSGADFAERTRIITELRAAGRQSEIESELEKRGHNPIPDHLAYLQGESLDGYLHDMAIAQRFATVNREAMLDEIVKGCHLHVDEQFTTVHNYIDLEHMVLRKGAVSAQAGERLIVPMNMRDGSLICTGKGNADWNCSAPHGAGRVMSRAAAKQNVSMEEYMQSMAGIWTTCVSSATVDESPMAYKPMQHLLDSIGDTVTVDHVVRSLYNFKAS